ncbi:hypothetical protein [Hymenobacter sp. CRA2]|uniref:hypothetical protein n=1 Tax=Hymenobacter sp. CRA2 TaxID=1955620 RepID=UPI00098F87B7|nr:hypothetical protein [Hymenobacter sp. CRA2]OON68045.1 hypothetical protein B0919_15415 [Hymenobacter sp. CRA2]
MYFPAAPSKAFFRKLGLLAGLWLLGTAAWATPPKQGFIARSFLLAILQGRYAQAYALLAPEVQTVTTPRQFRAAAQPIYQQGQQAGVGIELYRLGLRLGENEDSRWFYAFTFKSDSAKAAPVQLDVTFRDSAATKVLEFRLVPGKVR